ncbi:MAG: glycosyltransferase [Synergistaceae bacterium]|nr:glycosyltransferase [Synergistaceae bacterium]
MTGEKVSVIMASFNGIKYIGEQLDSIRTQSRTPDEVIICDDCSSDGTFEFCKDYISRYNLSGWRVFQNEKNLGFAKNFRYAFTLSNSSCNKGGGGI